LTIYDLGEDGFPITDSLVSFPSPISDSTGNIRPFYSFAIDNNKAYLAGEDPAVWVWTLADTGPYAGQPINPSTGLPVDPNTGQPATRYPNRNVANIGNGVKYDIAVNLGLTSPLLYLGSFGYGSETPTEPEPGVTGYPMLEVIKLDSTGNPITPGTTSSLPTDWYRS
jgi:hypothetical protein